MATRYTLHFENRSSNSSTVVLYQRDPSPSQGEYSLAWLAAPAFQAQTVHFTWEDKYSFVWGQMQSLEPGNVFRAAQSVPAELWAKNAITLESRGGALQLGDQKDWTAGSLLITNSGNVPMNTAVEGIAMGEEGNGVFVVQAQPNSAVQFQPHPEYWIVFGDFEEGEVLDSRMMFDGDSATAGSKQIFGLPAKVQFPEGIYTIHAILNRDNSWTIAPS